MNIFFNIKLKQILFFLIVIVIQSVFSQEINCFDVARKGNLSEMKLLFQRDNQVINYIDDKGFSMLIYACYSGNNDVASFLIDNNADINFVSKSGTALMACVVRNNIEMFDLLLLKAANVDLSDENGITPLILATQLNNLQIVKKLLKAKANKELKTSMIKKFTVHCVV